MRPENRQAERVPRKLSITDEQADWKKVILYLAIPSVLEQLSRIVVQYVDAAMVGKLGAYATAAVGINFSTTMLLGGVLHAVGVGFSVRTAMAVGAKEKNIIQDVVRQAIITTAGLGAGMSVGMQFLGNYLPEWLGAEEAVIPSAIAYVRIVTSVYVFRAISVTIAGLLRGMGDTKTPFYVNLGANIVNVIGNLIWIPQYGVAGAAIGTALSTVFSGTTLLILLLRPQSPIHLSMAGGLKLDHKILADVIKISGPMVLERLVLAGGQILMTMMVANLGTNATAVHYIVNTVSTIAYETATGFSVASVTLVAQCIGAKKKALAYCYVKRCLGMGVLVSCAFSIIIMAFAPDLVGLFATDTAVILQAIFICRMDAASEPMVAVSTVLCGAFRGYGDSKYSFFLSIGGIFVTRLVLGYSFGYLLEMGLVGIWIGIFADIVVRAILCCTHMKKYAPEKQTSVLLEE